MKNNEVLDKFEQYIRDNSNYWDLNIQDVRDFIYENIDELVKILR